MRTIVETQTIQPQVVETTWLVCEEPGCDFRTQDQAEALEHHGKTHAVRAELNADGYCLRRFDSEHDAQTWLDAEHSDWYRIRTLDWEGPGWYMTETWTKPCPRGCCTDDCVRLFAVARWIGRTVERARRIMQDVTSIRKALREAG